jgi:hypothetical protein
MHRMSFCRIYYEGLLKVLLLFYSCFLLLYLSVKTFVFTDSAV